MRIFILSLFLSCFLHPLVSQNYLGLSADFKRIDIPFELENDLIVVKVLFHKLFPLKFIFDTGAENTILSKKEFIDILNIPHEREFKVLGADMSTELTAYLVRNIHLKVEELVLPRFPILVLDDDYFRFEEVAGLEVHGIIGADAFRNLVVRINYEKMVISLFKQKNFIPPKNFEEIPIEVFRGKPYLTTDIQLRRDSTIKAKFLLDSGAMVSLLVNTNTHPDLKLPPKILKGNIGAGLGGYIEGYVGRTHAFDIGSNQSNEVVTYFQDINPQTDTSVLNGRNGILGNKMMKRFHLIINYPKEKLYIKPNRFFKKSFKFDKSGLVIIAASVSLDSYLIHEVIKDTPAADAGLLPGDKILSINKIPAAFLTLSGITRILRKKEGKQITLKIKRNGEKLKFKFRLRKLI